MVTGSFSPIGVSLDNLFYVGICNFHIFFKLFGLILFNISVVYTLLHAFLFMLCILDFYFIFYFCNLQRFANLINLFQRTNFWLY